MENKQVKELKAELTAIKNLLIVGLQSQNIKGGDIAKALGVSQGRLSQQFAKKKYKKKNGKEKGTQN